MTQSNDQFRNGVSVSECERFGALFTKIDAVITSEAKQTTGKSLSLPWIATAAMPLRNDEGLCFCKRRASEQIHMRMHAGLFIGSLSYSSLTCGQEH